MIKKMMLTIALATMTSLVASAQGLPTPDGIDLSGSWVGRKFTDAIGTSFGTGGGPTPVEYQGIPLNDSGRAFALTYSQSQLSMPERMCAMNAPTYIAIGPMGLRIWPEFDMLTGVTTAWIIGVGASEDTVPIRIWMDGRPHPSGNAAHDKSGFTTGVWVDDVLTTYTTHMPQGVIRRNGVPSSDRATMTIRFSRHDDILTLTARIDDPVYLTEPYYLSRDFVLTKTPLNPTTSPCTVVDEGIEAEHIPHYKVGQNPFVDEQTKLFGIPMEAVLGGAETAYPEFRKKIKDKYQRPDHCVNVPPGACGRTGAFPPIK